MSIRFLKRTKARTNDVEDDGDKDELYTAKHIRNFGCSGLYRR